MTIRQTCINKDLIKSKTPLPSPGVEQRVWSEAASIVFRNHVEKKPLVAQVECVVEAELPWDRKVFDLLNLFENDKNTYSQ